MAVKGVSRAIRYQLQSSELTLEVGNPAVAEKYAAFLTAHLASTKQLLLSQKGSIGSNIGQIPASILYNVANRLGVKEVKPVPSPT